MTNAVVIGAGIAGIAAAAALQGTVDNVTILERDILPCGPTARRGVPQSNQLHNLLARAQLHLEDLLPGFCERLRELGCGEGSVSSDTHVFELGTRMPERDLGLRLLCARRPSIDHAARTLLPSSVNVIDDVRVSDLRRSPDGRVMAIVGERHGQSVEFPADIVVDASGPAALAARWLASSGSAVPTDETHADQWYVSVEVEPTGATWDPHRFLLVFPTFPRTRGGLMSPAADGTWHVSLSGKSGDPIPRTFDEMVEYAATLEDAVLSERLTTARQHSTPEVYRKITATWRRFDRCDHLQTGVFAIGDSLAGLNPLFGQGISLIAWEAVTLRDLLKANGLDDLATVTRRYFDSAAEVVDAAWQLGAMLESSLVIEHEGTRVDLSAALASLVGDDPSLHARYVKIWHLLEPADSLADPEVRSLLIERELHLRDIAGRKG
jgi:2-polyprenyl-6-methoxyphenol hydroxylase-like FAD-dependent oxidoreductase